MLLDFNDVVENEIQIKEMTGLTLEQFNVLHIDVERRILERKKKLSGNPGKIKNKKINLLITLYHMKGYVVQRQMAIFFGVSQPQICRICNYYRKFIEISLEIKNEIEEGDIIHIVDATEQLIERPKNNEVQKEYYSGKKKRIR